MPDKTMKISDPQLPGGCVYITLQFGEETRLDPFPYYREGPPFSEIMAGVKRERALTKTKG